MMTRGGIVTIRTVKRMYDMTFYARAEIRFLTKQTISLLYNDILTGDQTNETKRDKKAETNKRDYKETFDIGSYSRPERA